MCKIRRHIHKIHIVILVSTFFISSWSNALESEPFTKERFDQLQREDALILVVVDAILCPTCRRQQEIVENYTQKNFIEDFYRLKVDYHTQKKWVNFFRAPYQSTLILYSGTDQLWFSVAETHKATIFRALNFGQLFRN